jgi:hypothetical protein
MITLLPHLFGHDSSETNYMDMYYTGSHKYNSVYFGYAGIVQLTDPALEVCLTELDMCISPVL